MIHWYSPTDDICYWRDNGSNFKLKTQTKEVHFYSIALADETIEVYIELTGEFIHLLQENRK